MKCMTSSTLLKCSQLNIAWTQIFIQKKSFCLSYSPAEKWCLYKQQPQKERLSFQVLDWTQGAAVQFNPLQISDVSRLFLLCASVLVFYLGAGMHFKSKSPTSSFYCTCVEWFWHVPKSFLWDVSQLHPTRAHHPLAFSTQYQTRARPK